MHRFNRPHIRVRQEGQTLIIALIVLGVLLILGLVFLGLVNRNIQNSARSQRRSESSDLAEAGIRYVHGQLVSSPLGADWRGIPATLVETPPGSGVTGDPDAYYLRPASGITDVNTGVTDLGGPDELGPFIRVNFPAGRALVRVRYGATDANPTKVVPGGPLRNPGAARSSLIIEAVGRSGVISTTDPTTFNATGGLQFKGFANQAALTNGIAAMAQADGQVATSRRLVAFATIGIIDAARFETNVFNSSAPIDLGIPAGLGIAAYNDVSPNSGSVDVGSTLSMQLGTAGAVTGSGGTPAARQVPRGFGSAIVNGDLLVHGTISAYLNQALGDGIRVAGHITGETAASSLILNPVQYVNGAYTVGTPVTLTQGGANSFDSQSASFNTVGGLLTDGSARTDQSGFASGVGILVPPSALTVDPQTKLNRYVEMTRGTGTESATTGAQGGAFGHGSGVYVDNTNDRQESTDAKGRQTDGSQRSLFDDWLNPNSGAAGSGWQGPFYVPVGASVQLLPDGFTIQRDGSSPTWKRPDGSDSSLSTIRYRLGKGSDGQVYVLDTLTTAKDINGNLAQTDFDAGLPFNGVLYFEGNVKVRGTIPTGVQLTLVSGATIYIDGSIVKGIQGNEVIGGRGSVITGLPTASLMLMAKDNVAVNTTTFFGPTATQTLEPVNDQSSSTNISPVRLRAAGGQVELTTEFPLDSAVGTNPTNWGPYALEYKDFSSNAALATQMLIGHTMDADSPTASFEAMDVNFGSGTSAYQFAAVDADGLITNAAATYALTNPTTATTIPLYGLGAEPWQRYARFELRTFPLIANPGGATYTASSGLIDQSGSGVAYRLFGGDNEVLLRPGSVQNVASYDTLIGRAAVVPSDVKIEASIFAEQGSFFIIPGSWFNPDPNDTHTAYAAKIAGGMTVAEANRERLEESGAAPGVPFYGEPLDVRLNIVGSVAENLPPPASVQAEWIRKWGWIPRRIGATGAGIPTQHVTGTGFNASTDNFAPNILIQYDPVLATGRVNDSNSTAVPSPIRIDAFNRPLPPMPRLPVSPRLAYFGEL